MRVNEINCGLGLVKLAECFIVFYGKFTDYVEVSIKMPHQSDD